jgi:hypothetical protein
MRNTGVAKKKSLEVRNIGCSCICVQGGRERGQGTGEGEKKCEGGE